MQRVLSERCSLDFPADVRCTVRQRTGPRIVTPSPTAAATLQGREAVAVVVPAAAVVVVVVMMVVIMVAEVVVDMVAEGVVDMVAAGVGAPEAWLLVRLGSSLMHD